MRVCVRFVFAAALLLATGCDRVQLLAPTNSTIVVSAPTRVLPINGSTEVTAYVAEQSGTPVQNGTVVRFITTLGAVSPVEVQTRNGLALTTFSAGSTSGIAEVRAVSGGAGAGASTGTGTSTSTSANAVTITIGAAAVNTVTLRANPGSVSPGGGTVELIANVLGENGRALDGIGVTFNTDQGTLSAATVITDSSGEARTLLTTSQKASVTATAGTKSSIAFVVDLRLGPGVSVTCIAVSLGSCPALQPSSSANTATVTFTVTKALTSSALRSATIDFGDGGSQSLGNLSGGAATISHTYTGPSGQTPQSYTATVVAVDINGESASAATTVSVTPRPTPTPIAVTLIATQSTQTATIVRWTFSATVIGGGESGPGSNATIETYAWDFGDGSTATTSGPSTSHVYERSNTGQSSVRTVSVTPRTTDGRTATAREEIIVQYLP